MVVGRHPKRKSPCQFSPVETFYNGHRFDRRLEARWAVALDTLGVGFRYHTASANPGEGSMLELPGFGDFWLLIRPGLPVLADIRRAKRWVANGTAQEVAILSGRPLHNAAYAGFAWWRNSVGDLKEDLGVLWQECLWCSAPCLATRGVPCPNCEERDVLSDSTERLAEAYRQARRMRFAKPPQSAF